MQHRGSRRTTALIGIAAAIAVPSVVLASPVGATAPPSVALTPVADVEGAVDLAWRDGDSSLYVVSQSGTITQVSGDTTNAVLDVTDLTAAGGERGLLGLAFSPAGDKAYVNFTDGDGHTNVAEFAVDDVGAFDRDSLRTVILIEQPYANHNGGDLEFGPDGMLYIGMGDGGDGGDPQRYSQNLESLLGKMLRVDPATPSGDLGYTIPEDNPFVGAEGARGEIWAIGLRNPWRFTFDSETGDLWIADVGQSAFEEINVAAAADGMNAGRNLNFGWSGYEGDDVFNDDVAVEDHQPPVYVYPHDGRCSVSGGVRARGEAAGPLDGLYVFADYCSGQVFALATTGEGSELAASGEAMEIATTGNPTAVLPGPDGAVYVLGAEGVSRLDPA